MDLSLVSWLKTLNATDCRREALIALANITKIINFTSGALSFSVDGTTFYPEELIEGVGKQLVYAQQRLDIGRN